MSSTQKTSQSDSTEFLIEFPFRLRSELPGFPVATDLIVSRMDDGTKTRLLKIEKAQYNDEGKLTGFTSLPGCLFLDEIGPDIDEIDEFCSSNYVLVAPSLERAKEFNFALKLAGNSSSALYIGFKTTTPAQYFLTPPCFFGKSALIVKDEDVKSLATLVGQIECARGDKKLQTMREIYVHALAKQRRKESRFIEIAIILEMLLLPSSSAELSYRFSLRLAKLLNKLTGEPINDAFKFARRIYTTRSHLVHAGSDKDLEEIGPVAYNYVRILLAAYLSDRTLFQEACLDELCLS